MTSSFHDFEQAGWQRAARHYPDAFGGLTAQAIGPLLDAVGAGPGVRLLDVATGPGYVAGAAAERGASVTGVDFSTAMIAEARRREPGVDFRDGDAEALPFPDQSFDAVVMSFGLLHLARPEAALAEARRVLVPGGRSAFTVWAMPDEAVAFGIALRAIETHGRLDVPLPIGPPFFHFSDPEECRRSLTAAGLVRVTVRHVPLLWRLSSPDAVFDALSRGAVRTAALLEAQSPEALAAIQSTIRAAVASYARGAAIELPMPAVLAAAARDR